MKTTDTTKDSQKKTTWSLQDNKRTEAQRDAFKATGKSPKLSTWKYVLGVFLVLLVLSYSLVQMYDKPLITCLTPDFFINSIEQPYWYTLFVCSNLVIIIMAFVGAYVGGQKLKSLLKL